jgi:hypothetical protein
MLKRTLLSVLAALGLALGLAACERGPGEKAGRAIDRAGERTRDAIDDTRDKVHDSTAPK